MVERLASIHVYVKESFFNDPNEYMTQVWASHLNGVEKTRSILHLPNRNLGVPVDLTRLRDLVWRLQGSPTLLLFTGVQEFTRLFHCQGCYSTICDLPLDCPGEGLGLGYQGRGRPYAGLQESPDLSPVQDLIVKRGNQALFSCTVGFQLPESELTYSWKFAEGGVSPERASWRA